MAVSSSVGSNIFDVCVGSVYSSSISSSASFSSTSFSSPFQPSCAMAALFPLAMAFASIRLRCCVRVQQRVGVQRWHAVPDAVAAVGCRCRMRMAHEQSVWHHNDCRLRGILCAVHCAGNGPIGVSIARLLTEWWTNSDDDDDDDDLTDGCGMCANLWLINQIQNINHPSTDLFMHVFLVPMCKIRCECECRRSINW